MANCAEAGVGAVFDDLFGPNVKDEPAVEAPHVLRKLFADICDEHGGPAQYLQKMYQGTEANFASKIEQLAPPSATTKYWDPTTETIYNNTALKLHPNIWGGH